MDNPIAEIKRLKAEKNAVILAHYYTTDEIQSVADYVGDSFYLAKVAKSSNADIIVFCGVAFMGESAKILNPNKKVIMPDLSADCPMAHMATKEKIKEMREKYDDLAVVCYINSTAELKRMSDVCVTSANAMRIVNRLPNKNIFFIPDRNLGSYVKKHVKDKNIIINDGYCPIHHFFEISELARLQEKYPDALVLAHPECQEELLKNADYIGSTSEIIDYVAESKADEFIICTERGVEYELKTQNPDKKFYFADKGCMCDDMKLNTLEKLIDALRNEKNEVYIDETARIEALRPLERMLELAK